MDVGQVRGNGGVDRTPDRSARADQKRDAGHQHGASDSAAISETGRETFEAVEGLTERAREDQPERRQLVEQAKQRLESGELDDFAVYRDVASRLEL